jgi:hypothetical protein
MEETLDLHLRLIEQTLCDHTVPGAKDIQHSICVNIY